MSGEAWTLHDTRSRFRVVDGHQQWQLEIRVNGVPTWRGACWEMSLVPRSGPGGFDHTTRLEPIVDDHECVRRTQRDGAVDIISAP